MNRLLSISFLLCAFCAISPARGSDPAHNFAKWEKQVKEFEAADRTNPPPANALLFVGSSTISFWTNLDKEFPQYPCINRGIGGTEFVDITHFADRLVLPYNPRMIIVFSGLNDVHAGTSPEQTFQDLQDFVAVVRKAFPKIDIALISLQPRISRWNERETQAAYNKLASEWMAKTPHLKFIDAWSLTLLPDGQADQSVFREDKLHFNEKGYKRLAELVRHTLPKP